MRGFATFKCRRVLVRFVYRHCRHGWNGDKGSTRHRLVEARWRLEWTSKDEMPPGSELPYNSQGVGVGKHLIQREWMSVSYAKCSIHFGWPASHLRLRTSLFPHDSFSSTWRSKGGGKRVGKGGLRLSKIDEFGHRAISHDALSLICTKYEVSLRLSRVGPTHNRPGNDDLCCASLPPA